MGCCHFMSMGNVGGRPSSLTPPPPRTLREIGGWVDGSEVGGWVNRNPKEANSRRPPPPPPSMTQQRLGELLRKCNIYYYTPLPLNLANNKQQASNKQHFSFPFWPLLRSNASGSALLQPSSTLTHGLPESKI